MIYDSTEKEINFLALTKTVPCVRILFLKKVKDRLRIWEWGGRWGELKNRLNDSLHLIYVNSVMVKCASL